jgi:hypothetical protein
MKTKTLFSALCLAAMLLAQGTVKAVPVNPVQDNTDLIGSINPGNPADPTNETAYANNLLTLFNGGTISDPLGQTYTLMTGPDVNPAPLPTPAVLDTTQGTGGQITSGVNGNTSFTLNLGSGYNYLLVKWDGPNGAEALYDIQGLTGTVTVNNTTFLNGAGQPFAASHADLFNPTSVGVPDSASTAVLLGVALIGIGLLRRKISKNPLTLI